MWLPEDERRLLVGYVQKIDSVDEPEWFDKVDDLSPLLKKGKGLKNDDTAEDFVSQEGIGGVVAEGFDRINRITAANNVLAARGLITVQPHDSEMNRVRISVTPQGHKWAMKYRTKFGCADAFYLEHKDGILGLVFSVIGGVFGGFLSHLLFSD